MDIYTRITSRNGQTLNSEITTGFLANYERDEIKKTHYFDGRYENIYLTEQEIPALTPLINEAIENAENILQLENIRAGYWFNYMPPGSATTLHTHDDDDELLSGVYYVDIVENSGNLIIYDDSTGITTDRANGDRAGSEKIEITPESGDFVFFKPDVRHEVSRNNSSKPRLSIGINFGQADTDPCL